MVKILVTECKQEVSSFNPVTSEYNDFTICRGQEILTFHRGSLVCHGCNCLTTSAEDKMSW